MARFSLLVLLVLAFVALCNGTDRTSGLRGLQQDESKALDASTEADKHGRYRCGRHWGYRRGCGWRALKGQQQEEATRVGASERPHAQPSNATTQPSNVTSSQQAQNATTTRAGDRPVAGNETRAQGQPANVSTAGEQRPVNASEANSTEKHSTCPKSFVYARESQLHSVILTFCPHYLPVAVVVGRPYPPPYNGYGYGYPGYGYGYGGCGYGCRKLRGNATTAQNATEAESANNTTVTARPREQRTGGTNQSEATIDTQARRPPVRANATAAENQTRAGAEPVNADTAKDWDGGHHGGGGWDGHHGGWDGHHGGWDDHHGGWGRGGWDGHHHHHGGWGRGDWDHHGDCKLFW